MTAPVPILNGSINRCLARHRDNAANQDSTLITGPGRHTYIPALLRYRHKPLLDTAQRDQQVHYTIDTGLHGVV